MELNANYSAKFPRLLSGSLQSNILDGFDELHSVMNFVSTISRLVVHSVRYKNQVFGCQVIASRPFG